MSIKAILFDFDGVLAETLPFHFQAWQHVLKEANIDPDEMTVKLNEGKPAAGIARALFAFAGREISEAEGEKFKNAKNREFREIQKAKVYPEIFEIVRQMQKENVRLGLVTGTTLQNIRAVLPDTLIAAFSVIVQDGDAKRGKPWPEPYLLAAEKLNIPINDCLVVENAPLGIESAKTAGAFCVALQTTLSAEHLKNADVIYKNHLEFLNALPEILHNSEA